MVRTPVNSCVKPMSRPSANWSTSAIMRLSVSPEGWLSRYASGSRCRWENAWRRTSRVTQKQTRLWMAVMTHCKTAVSPASTAILTARLPTAAKLTCRGRRSGRLRRRPEWGYRACPPRWPRPAARTQAAAADTVRGFLSRAAAPRRMYASRCARLPLLLRPADLLIDQAGVFSSACVPSPAMRPSSSTTILSACRMDDTRCEISTTVGFHGSRASALRSAASVAKSSAEALSSRMRSSGLRTSARAMVSR